MRLLLVFFSIIFFVSCDCNQTVNGFVYDKQTNKPILGATIYKKERREYAENTDSIGYFRLSAISGGISCPPMTVIIEHVDYQTQELTIPAGESKVIYLEKQ